MISNNTPTSAGTGIAMRVRGSANKVAEEWVDSNQQADEDEEEALARELKKAQKKLKKQQQLQDWLREKENRAMAAQMAAEKERKIIADADAAKEHKRKDYARRQKERITGYKSVIKREAEQLQELVELGIDPQSLVS